MTSLPAIMLLRVAGFGSNSIWAVGGGIQQEVARSTRLMVGYDYSKNPATAKWVFLNMPPLPLFSIIFPGEFSEVGRLRRNRETLSRFSAIRPCSPELGTGSHFGNTCDQHHA